MPFVTITLLAGKERSFIKSLTELIHAAMVNTINIAPEVLYHVVHEVKPEQMIYRPQFRGMQRSADFIFLQIVIRAGRTAELKKVMYQKIAEQLNAQLNIRKEDIMITVTENTIDDWYFGEASPA